MKKALRLPALALAALVLLGASGCGVTPEDILNVIAPTEPPAPTAAPVAAEPQTTEEPPVVVKEDCDKLTGVYSPFWHDSTGDGRLVALTQLPLLAEAGRESPSEVSYTLNEDGSVSVDIRLRQGLCFSDGESVTADDLIFTYYVLLDSDYAGPYSLSTLPITGLRAYQVGMDPAMYEKYELLYDEIYNGGRYDADVVTLGQDDEEEPADTPVPDGEEEEEDTYDREKAAEIKSAIELYWRRDTQYIVDYCMEHYGTVTEFQTGYKSEAVWASEGLQVMFAMICWDYGSLDDAGVLHGATTGTAWDLDTQFPTVDDFYHEMYTAYAGDAEAYWKIEGLDRACMLTAARLAVITDWAEKDEAWQGPVRSISGVERVDERTVRIALDYFDDASLQTLCGVYIAPLHWYGSEALYKFENESFGFTQGDLSAVRAKDSQPLGAGEYAFIGAEPGVATLAANEKYWLGAPETDFLELHQTEAP